MHIIHLSDLHVGKAGALDELKLIVAHILMHHNPAHTAVAITGDLVEHPVTKLYVQLRQALDPLVRAGFKLMAVPGNHDIFTSGLDLGLASRASYALWLKYIAPIAGAHLLHKWPQRWQCGELYVIGLDTNQASGVDWQVDLARGQVGARQLADLTLLLQDAPSVVIGHHRVWWDDAAHRLEDAKQLHDILDPRASLYLCGHQHREYDAVHGSVRYIAAPRSTQRHEGQLRYQVVSLDGAIWVHVD